MAQVTNLTQVTPLQNQKPACVFQKECVISKTRQIGVGFFGPCYVLTGYDPTTKYSFVAHIDDMTQVESIPRIFATLKELKVDSNDLQLKLMGGHKGNPESNKWGHKIRLQLEQEGVLDKVDMALFQKKETPFGGTINDKTAACKYGFLGGLMDPAKGSFQFFKDCWIKIEKEQKAIADKEVATLLKEAYPGEDLSHYPPQRLVELCRVLLMEKEETPLKITVI